MSAAMEVWFYLAFLTGPMISAFCKRHYPFLNSPYTMIESEVFFTMMFAVLEEHLLECPTMVYYL
jgi:hypothetical protein